MCLKVVTILVGLLVTVLSLYAIEWSSSSVPSVATSVSTSVVTSVSSVATSLSQLGALGIFGDISLSQHHHDVPVESLDKWSTSTLAHVHQAALVLVVDLNGGGNFTTVQSAVDHVPESSPFRTLIIVNAGVYR